VQESTKLNSFLQGRTRERKLRRSAGLQFEVVNLTNHVNVINFASLFSGTAVAPPRDLDSTFGLITRYPPGGYYNVVAV
jgi:hypothetical protein